MIRLGYLFVALGFRSETRRDHAGRLWLTALSRLVNRRRWPEIFPVTPATILRWHRDLAPASGPARTTARRYSDQDADRCDGAGESGRGQRRIQGELARPGYAIAASAVREILHAAGTGPAPRRAGPAWRQFLAAQARAIIARDFRVAGTVLLKRLYVLVFTGRGARRRHLAGVTAHPAGAWAVQQARSLAMDLGDRLGTLRFLMHDRDPLCTTAFGEVFKAEGLQIITTLPRMSRMNAVCERVIGTFRCGLPGRILILGDRHPVLVLRESLVHYDRHRPAHGPSAGNPSSPE